ncbi:hypothetical protein SLEP1_g16125 [Rubroshorea leprosula]|uniref:Uncharacterized protein n=1 Tax=Rubroshorea leprosula TaxID=152421 RepID=A0AAV5IVK3_9ROSI|nr:hypothetical protein SLEP1_g16125 [Rubroshorea leprosula]
MTYRGDVYFVSVPVSVFRDCTCWHALSLIRALHIYLLSLSHSFPCPPFQEVKPRTGKPREVTS